MSKKACFNSLLSKSNYIQVIQKSYCFIIDLERTEVLIEKVIDAIRNEMSQNDDIKTQKREYGKVLIEKVIDAVRNEMSENDEIKTQKREYGRIVPIESNHICDLYYICLPGFYCNLNGICHSV